MRGRAGVDLKMGVGDPFQSNFTYLAKLSTFDPMSEKYSAKVFQESHKTHFLLHFHVYCFRIWIEFEFQSMNE